jgi:hypothetical protein
MKIEQGIQCTNNVTLSRVGATIVTVKKVITISYPKCTFVSLGTQRAMHMRHIVTCGLHCCTVYIHTIV